MCVFTNQNISKQILVNSHSVFFFFLVKKSALLLIQAYKHRTPKEGKFPALFSLPRWEQSGWEQTESAPWELTKPKHI